MNSSLASVEVVGVSIAKQVCDGYINDNDVPVLYSNEQGWEGDGSSLPISRVQCSIVDGATTNVVIVFYAA